MNKSLHYNWTPVTLGVVNPEVTNQQAVHLQAVNLEVINLEDDAISLRLYYSIRQ